MCSFCWLVYVVGGSCWNRCPFKVQCMCVCWLLLVNVMYLFSFGCRVIFFCVLGWVSVCCFELV